MAKNRNRSTRRNSRRTLVRESEWLRVYKTRSNLFIESSKFLEDGLELNADEFEKSWDSLSACERLDICAAYHAKRRLSANDERILNFIMERGDELTWSSIVSVLTRLSDRERVAVFIKSRLERQRRPLANFYHAVEIIQDSSAVPVLLAEYQRQQKAIEAGGGDQLLTIDYLTCCRTLWKLTGSDEYRAAIERYLNEQDALLRASARRLLH